MVTLFLIFLPKYLMQRRYAGLSEAEQKRLMAQSVIESSLGKTSAMRNPSFTMEGSGAIIQRVNEAENHHEPLGKVKEASNEKSLHSLILSVQSAVPDNRISVEEMDLDAVPCDSGDIKVSSHSIASSLKLAAKGEDSRSEAEAVPTSEAFDSDEITPSEESGKAETPSCAKEEGAGSDTEPPDSSQSNEPQKDAVLETSESREDD